MRGRTPVLARRASYLTTWHRLRAKHAGQRPALRLSQPVLHSALDNFARRKISYDPVTVLRRTPGK